LAHMISTVGLDASRGSYEVVAPIAVHTRRQLFQCLSLNKQQKGSPYSITERRVPELILVLGSHPAGDVSHKHGVRLPLLSARPAVTRAALRGLLPVSLLGEQRNNGCEQFAQDCYPTASRLRFEHGPFCA